MAKINLRPWREELRKDRQNEYIAILGFVFIAAVAIWWSINSAYMSAIEGQQYRNQYIETQSASLDKKIKEIKELRTKKNQLLERMRLIQDLQGNRPVIVRIFDEMARVMPNDLFFESVTAEGNGFSLKGRASSNDKVSQLMRNFDQSPWFSNPNLLGVKANKSGFNSFEMQVSRSRPALGEVK